MQRKSEKAKVKLTIVIPQSEKKIENEGQQTDEIYVKPIYSVKNARKVPVKFNFDREKIETMRERKSKKLEKEKDVLLSSLDVLKFGAISAIAEKQEQIDTLKSQLGWEEVRQLEDQVEQLLQERKQLREEIEQLQEKLLFERSSYMRLLQQKDRVIEELYVELNSTQLQIEKLQKYEEMKQKKIKIIEQQNNYLFHQLEEQKIAHIKQTYETAEKHVTMHVFEDSTPEEPSFGEMNEASLHQEQFNIEEIQTKHRDELNQITAFYEKRMAEMREIYEKELQLWPLEHSKQNSITNQLLEDVVSLKQTNVPVPNKLSSELNARRLSDCYSMTRRDLSKYDKESMQASDRDPIDYNFKFLKRVANTPASQTTTSLKLTDGFKFMATEDKKRNDTQISDEKQVPQEPKQKNTITSFVLGALTGGTFAFLITKIFKT